MSFLEKNRIYNNIIMHQNIVHNIHAIITNVKLQVYLFLYNL